MANILLINHLTDDQICLKGILKDAGYQVAIAADTETALSLANQLHPELVICVRKTDKIDGLAISQKMRFDAHSIPPFFIMLTSTPAELEQLFKTEAEIDDGLVLPVKKPELLAHVRLGLRINRLNQRVKKHQNKLLQNDKNLSLGQMVSGIAHEINNPVSLITGNISHAAEYTQDLLELIQIYTEKYPDPDPEIQDLVEEVDLEFLMDDLPQVINSMKTGADRIRKLVQSLRNFYHADETEQKFIDVHAGMDDILLILQGRLKGKQGQPIQIIKEYGDLPSVECYPGQLNQVFMNLLNNAIDALDVQRLEDVIFEPKIWIKTETMPAESQVRIRIKDNGIGISEEMRSHIFDPFFMTQETGQGTGFGLSISHAIITENHGGKIKFCSDIGQGSEFMIEIPITQSL